MTYSGWTNYETWAAKLWLDNEYGSYKDATGKAREIAEDARDMEQEPDVYAFEQWLESYDDDTMPVLGGSLASDLLRSAFQEINWREIAESYLADAREELARDA